MSQVVLCHATYPNLESVKNVKKFLMIDIAQGNIHTFPQDGPSGTATATCWWAARTRAPARPSTTRPASAAAWTAAPTSPASTPSRRTPSSSPTSSRSQRPTRSTSSGSDSSRPRVRMTMTMNEYSETGQKYYRNLHLPSKVTDSSGKTKPRQTTRTGPLRSHSPFRTDTVR